MSGRHLWMFPNFITHPIHAGYKLHFQCVCTIIMLAKQVTVKTLFNFKTSEQKQHLVKNSMFRRFYNGEVISNFTIFLHLLAFSQPDHSHIRITYMHTIPYHTYVLWWYICSILSQLEIYIKFYILTVNIAIVLHFKPLLYHLTKEKGRQQKKK